jgi:hypothetical protein
MRFLAFAALLAVASAKRRYVTKSYRSPDAIVPGVINVHLVPHS